MAKAPALWIKITYRINSWQKTVPNENVEYRPFFGEGCPLAVNGGKATGVEEAGS